MSVPQNPPSLWDLAQEAWFIALAIANRPDTFNGYNRGSKTDEQWFPDLVFMETYPEAKVPIDPANAADVVAWKRIRDKVREALLAQKAQTPVPPPPPPGQAPAQAIDPTQPIWPLPSAPKSWSGGGSYGAKRPWNKPQTRWHTGTDLAAPAGMPVLATEPGVIVAPNSGWESKTVNGQLIGVKSLIMRTDSGKTLLYGGIRPNSAVVKAGERVVMGQKLAEIGNYPLGDHMLHFNVFNKAMTEAQVNAQKEWKLGGAKPTNLVDSGAYLKAARANTRVVVAVMATPELEPDQDSADGEQEEGTPQGDPDNTQTTAPPGASAPSSPSSGGGAAIAGVLVVGLLGYVVFGGGR